MWRDFFWPETSDSAILGLMKKKVANKMAWAGNLLILFAIAVFVFTFWPVAKEEVKYTAQKTLKVQYAVEPKAGTTQKKLSPPNTDFSIVIPKIGAAAPVVADVDSQDSKAYLAALRKGVAHAKNTAYPGKFGNTYLFAHSTDAFYNVSYYNAVFYLLGKLTKGDEIDIYYKGTRYIYSVADIKVVEPKDVAYLGTLGEWNTLTLQTCYPPGTTLKRLVVIANQVTP
jgi:LPXTG-site transpeptidase (sortase) family protein